MLVEVPAPAQQHLGAAVDDLTVRKIGALLAFQQRLAFVAVQGQGQAGFEGEFCQKRQKPGIAPGGLDHVRVITAQVGPQADQQRDGVVQRHGILDALTWAPTAWVRDYERFGLRMRRIAVGFEREDAQGRGCGIQFPRRIQRSDVEDLLAVDCATGQLQPAVRQREEIKSRHVAQRNGDIRIVPGEVREGRHQAVKDHIQLDGFQDFNR